MANETYKVSDDDSNIFLSVAVSTAGIADTDPELISGLTRTDLNCISGPTGNLTNVLVGASSKLNGQSLGIGTLVDLQSVSSDLWPTMFNSLVVHYTLSGGADGTQFFQSARAEITKDASGQFLKAFKTINLSA
jgi:hypothetical protein